MMRIPVGKNQLTFGPIARLSPFDQAMVAVCASALFAHFEERPDCSVLLG